MMNTPITPWGTDKTEHFFALTPEHVLSACEVLGFRATGRIQALGSMENRVYEVELDLDQTVKLSSPSDRFRIIKFYRPGRWSWDGILDEHDFLLDLIEADLPVIAPWQNADGHSLFVDRDLGLLYAMFPKVGGRAPDEILPETAEQMGRLMARMHAVGKTRSADHRVHLNEKTYGKAHLAWMLEHQIIPAEFKNQYSDIVLRICEFLEPLFRTHSNQRIHGDAHLGNLLWGAHGPFWVDFDDMVIGPPIQDIWLMLPGRDQRALDILALIIKGYKQMGDFEMDSLRMIEGLRALRMIHFTCWIARRWEDPSFKRGFPSFGTETYWAGHLRDLHDVEGTLPSPFWKI